MTKILVIEDEPILRDEIVEWLSFEGYEALGAADGLEGIDIIGREDLDLIVSDITMPRLDGYGVLFEMRSNPATAYIPFIFLSARASHEDMRRGMILGADDYITKPFSRVELLEGINARLAKKSVQEFELKQQIEQLETALIQEQEHRVLSAKLVAMFSHDFRNQLTVIMSSGTLIRDYSDRLDAARRQNHLNNVISSAQQLVHMLDDMLLTAQMETGNLTPAPRPIIPGEFFEEIVQEFGVSSANSHTLILNCDGAKPFMADTRLLRQVTVNLISNALKYSPTNTTVNVEIACDDNCCYLAVQDEGIGIPLADQQYLFEAFRRGSNVGKIHGTGLGLAIVKQGVDMMGGTIGIESDTGQGATFTVTFPYLSPQDA